MGLGKGTLTIENSNFARNKAGAGGAVIAYNNTNKLIVNNSSFIDNQANAGGAIIAFRGLTITDSQFTGNTVIGSTDGGGALFLGAVSSTVIKGSVFDGNKSKTSTGGAIATRQGDWGNNADAKLEIINTVFKNNTALGEYQDSLTDEMKAIYSGRGGAIQNAFYSSISDPARVTIKGSSFEGNKAIYGGAIILNFPRKLHSTLKITSREMS